MILYKVDNMSTEIQLTPLAITPQEKLVLVPPKNNCIFQEF